MRSEARAAIALASLAGLAAGCKSGSNDAPPLPVPRTALTELDAGVAPVDAGITTLKPYDPDDGFFLDPDPAAARPADRAARRNRTPVSLLLRSTPVGAIALVDGTRLGPTPVLWEGDGGKAYNFTFVLAGHALARYRFVPITSGVVHGTLVRMNHTVATPEVPPHGAPPATTPAATRPPPPPPAVDAAPPPEAIDAAVVAPPVTPTTPPVGPTP